MKAVKIVWTDVLVIILVLLFVVAGKGDRLQISEVVLHETFLTVVVYFAARFVFTLSPRLISALFIISVSIICLYESGLGILQIFGVCRSNHSLYSCTGSFINPGPYGGFLAICVSVLGIYAFSKNPGVIRSLAGFSAVITFAVLPSTQSRAAIVALLVAVSFAAFLNPKSREILKKHKIVISLFVVLFLTMAYVYKKPSADGRLMIDRISIKAMTNNGLRGAGLGRFGGSYGVAQFQYFKDKIGSVSEIQNLSALKEGERMTADIPEYAFNEILRVGVEAGPLAMIVFISLFLVGIVYSVKERTAWCYGLVAYLTFSLFSYPLSVPYLRLMLAVLLAGSCVIERREMRCLDLVPVLTALLCITFKTIMMHPQAVERKEAAALWEESVRWQEIQCYEMLAYSCDTIYDRMTHDSNYLFAYGQSLNKIEEYDKSDSVLTLGTLISSDPMFWNVMGNNSLAKGHYSEAEERYLHAFFMVPNRLYPLCLLTKLYYAKGDYDKARMMAKTVMEFKPKVESIKTENLRKEIYDLLDDIP